MKKFKRYFGLSQSVVNCYRSIHSIRKRTIYVYISLFIFLCGFCFFIFTGGESSPKVNPINLSNDSRSAAVNIQLHRQLDFLNRQALPLLKRSMNSKPISKASTKRYHTLPQTFTAARGKIKPARLSASAMLYAHPGHTTSHLLRLSALPAGKHKLLAGEVIHAVLESAIHSDLTGPVRALVSEPVYASRGTYIIIPVGTRLLGAYHKIHSSIQTRIGVRWKRMILPDGRSVSFDFPLTDPLGRIGVAADQVNRHFWSRFGAAGLYSVLSAGTQLADGAQASTLTAGQHYADQLSGSFSTTAQSLLEKNIHVMPTLFLNPGAQVSVFVRRDILF